jgi:hypothetical protein
VLRDRCPGDPVHGVVDPAEYATDLPFPSRAALAGWSRALRDDAARRFTPKDLRGVRGRTGDRGCDGAVHTPDEDDRGFGTRIKHRGKSHGWKRHDQFGLVLRVETVSHGPKEFGVDRARPHRDGTSAVGDDPRTKNVASLVDNPEPTWASNRRSLNALAVVDEPAPADSELRPRTEPPMVDGRGHAGFHPARRDDVRRFAAVREGDPIARGCRQGDSRERVFGLSKEVLQRRARAAVGRRLQRVDVRQLVAKIPRTRRWRVTQRGRRPLGVAVQLDWCSWPELAA